MKTKKIATALIILFSIILCKANNPAILSNLKGTIDQRNSKLIIVYDLLDKENDQLEVRLRITDENGLTYIIDKSNAEGDIGFPVSAGKNRRIVWTYDKKTFNPKKSIIKLVADDRYKIDISQLIKEVDTVRMIKDLNYILGERNSSNSTTQMHLERVGEYIKNSFKDNGVNSYYHRIELSNSELNKIWTAKTGLAPVVKDRDEKHNIKNVIGSITGQSQQAETFILSAHYDSYPGSLGMDDNASGVIGLLEAMRILSKYQFDHTIKFIGFDKEEDGLIGSLSYVFGGGIKESEKIGGVINLDMIGVCSDKPDSQIVPEGFDQLYPEVCKLVEKNKYRGDFVINTSNENSTKLSELFLNTANKYVGDLKVVSLLAEDNGKYAPALAESDHASFWYNNNSALHIGEGGATRNPDLHTPRDSKPHIKFNYKFMSDIVKTTIAVFVELAKAEHYTIANIHLTE
ncbi:M28 family peptidase [Flavobacterium aestivum]|uniref:M28 family peptidase n=1 Tax=Flavobacterium aestivum TaxID=3003257 RepID=UPI002285FDB3|nr:M28 family peptidase [Flavobacterium aestivum]